MDQTPLISHSLRFRQLPGLFAVCKLMSEISVPRGEDGLICITSAQGEVSLVCPQDRTPEGSQTEKGWICFQLQGPFPFTMTGVLAGFISPLAIAAIPIFAISTYDTDYVLIKQEQREQALSALIAAGHELLF